MFKALLDTAQAWLRERGMTRMQGPFNLNINEETGLLVAGFDTPPMLLMGHDKSYIAARLEELGLSKVKDVYAYLYDIRRFSMFIYMTLAEFLKSHGHRVVPRSALGVAFVHVAAF